MPSGVGEFPQVCLHCSFNSEGGRVSLDFHTLLPPHCIYSLTLRGHLSPLKKIIIIKESYQLLNTYCIPGIAFIYFLCEILTKTMIDIVEAGGVGELLLRGEALQRKRPGFTLRMGGQSIPCKTMAYDAFAAEDQRCFGDAQPHSLLPLS